EVDGPHPALAETFDDPVRSEWIGQAVGARLDVAWGHGRGGLLGPSHGRRNARMNRTLCPRPVHSFFWILQIHRVPHNHFMVTPLPDPRNGATAGCSKTLHRCQPLMHLVAVSSGDGKRRSCRKSLPIHRFFASACGASLWHISCVSHSRHLVATPLPGPIPWARWLFQERRCSSACSRSCWR